MFNCLKENYKMKKERKVDKYFYDPDTVKSRSRADLRLLSNYGGFVFEPLCLRQLFYEYLKKYHNGKMIRQQARTMANVYACLLNEYYTKAIVHDYGIVEFYVSPDRWLNDYCLSEEAVNNSVKFLREIGLIDSKNRWDKVRKTKRRWYIIYIRELEELVNRAEKLEKIKERRRTLLV